MKSLNEQYRLIQEGKGHKDVFLKEAKRLFPNYIRMGASFNEATTILHQKGIINNIINESTSTSYRPKEESWETKFNEFLTEAGRGRPKQNNDKTPEVKAEEKNVSKEVEKKQSYNFDRRDEENPDNVIFDQLMKGYYCEMGNPKNSEKSHDEIKSIVLKNLKKEPLYYTKNGQFGIEGLGYEMEVPGLGEPKEPKGPHKSSGYGTLEETQLRKSIKSIIKEELNNINEVFQLQKYNKEKLKTSYKTDDKGNIWIIDPKSGEKLATGKIPQGKSEKEIASSLVDELFENNTLNESYWSDYSDSDIAREVEAHGGEELIVWDGEGFLANRDELEQYLMNSTKPDWEEDNTSYPSHSTDGSPDDTSMPSWMAEQKLRKAIRLMAKKEIISENKKAQKAIKAIEDDAKLAEISTKLESINRAIEERNNRLSSIEENEDMKELMDKKALKELKKEIKTLEKYQKKCSKMYEKLTKKTNGKEVVTGEGDPIEEEKPSRPQVKQEENPEYKEKPKPSRPLVRQEKNPEYKEKVKPSRPLVKQEDNPEYVTEAEGDSEDIEKMKTGMEDIAKTAKEVANLDLFEVSEDELSKMKDELESYLDIETVGNAREAVDLYIKNHPEAKSNETTLLQLASPMFP